jgi:hypothetical protein
MNSFIQHTAQHFSVNPAGNGGIHVTVSFHVYALAFFHWFPID